jgi:hypothetical protein
MDVRERRVWVHTERDVSDVRQVSCDGRLVSRLWSTQMDSSLTCSIRTACFSSVCLKEIRQHRQRDGSYQM